MTQSRPGTSPFVEELVTIAVRELHHDGDDSEVEVQYERAVLQIKFTKLIREKFTNDEVLLQFANWYAARQAEFHACMTGDCDHWEQDECSLGLIKEFKDSEST